MSLLEAFVLGLVQGFTEFFPVSSSAHLKITKELLNIADSPYFDLVCHGGTTLALGIYLRKAIWQVLTTPRAIAIYFCAIIPLVPAYFLFGSFFKAAAAAPQYLGYCLMITGMLLFLASRGNCKTPFGAKSMLFPLVRIFRKAPMAERICRFAKNRTNEKKLEFGSQSEFCNSLSKKKREISCREIADFKWKDVLCIGMMQTMALIPGISRSGSTISAARFCGWNWLDAARFSFLLAVPTILGGEMLEIGKLIRKTSETAGTLPWGCYATGFATSFIFGLIGVHFMFRIYEKEIIRPFAWYCLAIGLLALRIFHA